jgi:hypothetical protein
METLKFHRANPLSLENTSVTPSMIGHEIHARVENEQLTQVLIVDCSPTRAE